MSAVCVGAVDPGRRSRIKRIVIFLVAVAIAAGLFATPVVADSSVAPQPPQKGTVQVGTSVANVRSGPGTSYRVVAQLRTGAVVTILESVAGPSVYGGPPVWYRIGDGRYIYSALVKITGAAQPTPPAPPPPMPQPQPSAGKWIEVILSQQKLIARENGRPVLETIVSTGKRSTPTVKGTFHIYAKYLATDMAGPGYYQPRVPHTMYFYRGYAIHGCYWHNRFGTPVSHGCVNLNLKDAAWLYNWAPIGTKVVVRD